MNEELPNKSFEQLKEKVEQLEKKVEKLKENVLQAFFWLILILLAAGAFDLP